MPRNVPKANVKENKHHNVPGSRGGSDEECNLSLVQVSRHDEFHNSFAQNYTIDEVTRRVIYDSLVLDDNRTLTQETARNIFEVLTVSHWARLYRAGTITSLAHPRALKRVDGIREYTRAYLDEEKQWIERTLDAIKKRTGETSAFLQSVLNFCGTSCPIEAVKKLYQEKYQGGYAWVKALHTETRRSVRRYLADADITHRTAGVRADLLRILHVQQKHIRKNLKEWS